MIHNPENPGADQELDPQLRAICASLINRIHSSTDKGGEQRCLTVGLTSCGPSEGVSTVSANLAKFCAQHLEMETLLVDMSNGESVFQALNGDVVEKGMRQVLNGNSYLFTTIVPTSVPRLQFLPRGLATELTYTPSTLHRFSDALAQLKSRYDIVLVDLPPAAGYASGLPIANQLDAVVLVIKPGTTKKKIASDTSRQLRRAGINLVGAVANDGHLGLPPAQVMASEFATTIWETIRIPLGPLRSAWNYLFATRQR